MKARAIAAVSRLLIGNRDIKTATKYLSPTLTVRATAFGKRQLNDRRLVFTVAVGKPNYAESQFIKKCKKAGQSFPVRKVQLRWRPARQRHRGV